MYYENIDKQIATTLKSGDVTKLAVWRAIKNEFTKFRTASAGNELNDDKELQIISKMVQQRKDSIEQYLKANREELAQAEEKELIILQSLLPQEATESDIIDCIEEYKNNENKEISLKEMRNIMTYIKTKHPVVNGALVSKVIKEKFI